MLRIRNKLLAILVLIGSISMGCTASAPSPPAAPVVERAGEAKGEAWQVEWNRALAGARKEGKLMIYSTPSGEVMREVATAFKAKFGVELDFVVGRGEEHPRRMEMEKQAGINVADVVISGATTLVGSMKAMGLLGKLEPLFVLPEVKDPSAWAIGSIPFLDKDSTSLAMIATYQRYIFQNTDMIKDGEITSYKDIINPKWKGKIVLDDPTVSGSGIGFVTLLAVHVLGMDETKEYLRQLVRLEPAIIRDKRLQGEWVARGKYPLGIAIDREVAADFIRAGAPVAFAKVKEGTMMGTAGGGLAVPVTSPHPDATRVFVNWILSREGHALFIKGYGSPGARRDAPREGIPATMFAEPGEKAYLETEDLILVRRQMTNVTREVLTPLLK